MYSTRRDDAAWDLLWLQLKSLKYSDCSLIPSFVIYYPWLSDKSDLSPLRCISLSSDAIGLSANTNAETRCGSELMRTSKRKYMQPLPRHPPTHIHYSVSALWRWREGYSFVNATPIHVNALPPPHNLPHASLCALLTHPLLILLFFFYSFMSDEIKKRRKKHLICCKKEKKE